MRILKNEGASGFFKGMTSPMIGVAVINACLFGVYGFILETLSPSHKKNNSPDHSIMHVFWAGCGSGLANSIISGPSELAKIKLQQQERQKVFRGPMHFFKHSIKIHGWKSLFQGMTATIIRETPSYGVYFATFELLSRKISTAKGQNLTLTPIDLMLAGGLAGVAGWLSTYPFDVAKTKMQAAEMNTYRSVWHCMIDIYKKEGSGAFTRGMGATILRAFPTNAVIFLTFKQTTDFLESNSQM